MLFRLSVERAVRVSAPHVSPRVNGRIKRSGWARALSASALRADDECCNYGIPFLCLEINYAAIAIHWIGTVIQLFLVKWS